MARIKLDLPDHFPFETRILLDPSHVNRGGHLANDTLFALVNRARVAFFASLGYDELDVEGAGTIMSDAVIVFKAEAFAGDELAFQVTAGEFTRIGCDLFYRVSNVRTGVEVARVKTAIGFFDYRTHRLLPVPEEFRKRFD